jgi:hypothetical protein
VVVDDTTARETAPRSALLLASGDALPLGQVLTSVPEFTPARPGWPSYETWLPPSSHELAAPPPKIEAPQVQVITDAYDAASDRRELRLRASAPGAQMRLGIPSARLVAWSLGAPPEATLELQGQRVIHLEGLDTEGAELSLTVRGRAPLPVELRAVAREPHADPAVDSVVRRLPAWTTTTTTTFHLVRREL